MNRPLAVITGASTGIGYELAKLCGEKGYDLVVVADEPAIESAATTLRATGAMVEDLQADLATVEGVDSLLEVVGERPIAALFANAGRGLGHAFLDQEWPDIRRVIDTNVTGTLYLLHKVGRRMRAADEGKILITGSIAGFMPGTYNAVCNGTKALLDSFAIALRAELADTKITVTCLMPGATATEFFERAGMLDTAVGASKKQRADEVAKIGFDALLRGQSDVVAGWQNKLQVALAHVVPAKLLAHLHARKAAPGSAPKS
ncbi:MAG: SDR family NAD(P)-dependent oxidoreductase [Polyangiaceae bacterium]